jgi:hypothetical protein
MRHLFVLILVFGYLSVAAGQVVAQNHPPVVPSSAPGAAKPSSPPQSTPPRADDQLPTETITSPPNSQAMLKQFAQETGYMNAAQVIVLLHKMWLAEYRVSDLLSQVHPDKWKIPDAARNSFEQTLSSLQSSIANFEDWRGQFAKRPDSMYLGYKTYASVNAILPRLDGVARSMAKNENASIAAQFSQAENLLFDAQQALEPYLSFLLKNQDGLVYAAQTNLASCQNELGYALHNRAGKAVPMKNINPAFKGHPRHRKTKEAEEKSASEKHDENSREGATGKTSKPAPKPAEASKK